MSVVMSISAVGKRTTRIFGSAFNLLFPPRCVSCRGDLHDLSSGSLFCTECLERLFPDPGQLCPRCARPVPAVVKVDGDCARCQKERYRFDQATALGVYRADLRETVIAMKHMRSESLTWAVGGVLATYVSKAEFSRDADVIVPVPIHWSRRMSRGMNVAELLAERLGPRLRIPVANDALKCRRRTKKQSTLSASERRANVRGAFATTKRIDLKDAKILLVDDVMTTGATANEASQVCRSAGAASVAVAVVARGVGID